MPGRLGFPAHRRAGPDPAGRDLIGHLGVGVKVSGDCRSWMAGGTPERWFFSPEARPPPDQDMKRASQRWVHLRLALLRWVTDSPFMPCVPAPPEAVHEGPRNQLNSADPAACHSNA